MVQFSTHLRDLQPGISAGTRLEFWRPRITRIRVFSTLTVQAWEVGSRWSLCTARRRCKNIIIYILCSQ